ncbi:MAG: S16 family serine protease, partial [Acidobacteriota bacterium]
AAHRAGIKIVLLPKENLKDLKEIPKSVQEELELIFVESMDEVLKVALERPIQTQTDGKDGKEEKLIKQAPPQIEQTDRPGVH